MTDISTQPTQRFDAISQDTVDDVKTVVSDPQVVEVFHDAQEVFKETKSGWKTTEFWLTIAGLLAVNLNGVVLTLPDKYQLYGSTIIAGLYALSRGVAKSGIPAPQESPVAIAPVDGVVQRPEA